MKKNYIAATLLASFLLLSCNKTGNTSSTTAEEEDTRSTQERLFDDGNYALFMHFGLYSKLEGEWKDKPYYGIAEWIMHPALAGISAEEYMAEAATFNPCNFDAEKIVAMAKDAGMKYIVITAKHHEGFAMFQSNADKFNICDGTELKRDLMKELADACHKHGLGIGFYYSQFQDWTAPGGGNGPKTDSSGREVSFDEYFRNKCVPQVEELTTKYGELQLVWFDTPSIMGAEYSKELVEIVHRNQPGALVSSRVGNDMGDYESKGDMEIPISNIGGRWEGIDVMQVGWAYNKFDEEWKSPDYIIRSLTTIVARGGTYMLNVGPRADGTIHPRAIASLHKAGEWVRRYSQTIYKAGPSPWGHALPWGDAVVNDGKVYLIVYEWPSNGELWLPGLENSIKSAQVVGGSSLKWKKDGTWTCLSVPYQKPDKLASVIELTFDVPAKDVKASSDFAVDPNLDTQMSVLFGKTENCEVHDVNWMKRYGEWFKKYQISGMTTESSVTWTVNIPTAGYYDMGVECKGNNKAEWKITTDEGEIVRDMLVPTNAYDWHRMGWLHFQKPGTHTITLQPLDGDYAGMSLSGLKMMHLDIEVEE